MRVIRTFGSHPYFRIVESQRLHPRTVCARPAEYFHNHHHHHQQQHDCRNQQHHNGQQENQHQHPQESQQQQRHEGVARYYDLTEAFDQMHRDFFRGFPMRRYVHSDLFHRLDEQFAQEYNRLAEQQQAARKTNSAANAADTKNTTSAESQNKPFNKESNKVTNQQSNTGKQDVAEHTELDLYPFFRSPFHLRNLEKTFEEERQRLSKVMEEFQERMNAQAAADPSKTRTIKENYHSTPEGYVHEFSDSKHPQRNFSIDTRKKQALTDEGKTSTAASHATTTTTNQRTSQSFEKEKQQHKSAESTCKAQEKTEEVAQKQQQYQQQQQQEILSAKQTFEQTNTTSQNQAAPEPVVKTEEVQTNSAKNQNDGRIDISPELNQKAKQLSIMLNKDYMESLELARVYTNKSVGQIIDLVLAAQQEQTY